MNELRDIGLTMREQNILTVAGIETLEKFRALTYNMVLRMPLAGRHTAEQVMSIVNSMQTPASQAEPDRCENCRYWTSTSGDYAPDDGACRRYPPNITQINDRVTFPIVASMVWCGEHKS